MALGNPPTAACEYAARRANRKQRVHGAVITFLTPVIVPCDRVSVAAPPRGA